MKQTVEVPTFTPSQLQAFMEAARIEGRKALPDCRPNPPVGCIIVENGEIIARGFTQEPGKPHAEVMAMRQLPDRDGDFTMFVTLEPCSFQGRTPSCARGIVSRKIASVYVGILDPHPKNRGAGIDILKEAGVHVEVGLLGEEIDAELSPFLIRD